MPNLIFTAVFVIAVVAMVAVLPPAAICPAAPKYCKVVGALRLVSLPFHNATSCSTISPSAPR